VLLAHVRFHRLGTAEVADDLGVDVLHQQLVTGLSQWSLDESAGRRSVIDQNIDAAQVGHGILNHLFHRLTIGRIGGNGNDPPASRPCHLLGRGLQRVTTPTADHHVDPFTGQFQRNSFANSSTAAGDDGDFACQFQIHGVVLSGNT
jgi:hypothetical protein